MPKPPATDAPAADLIAFWETTCGVAIPPIFRCFLLGYDGHALAPIHFTVVLADGTAPEFQLQSLCTLQEVAENWPFDKELTFYHDLMTLGNTHRPEMLFIGVRPWNIDQVFLLDAEGEAVFVAQNLDAFLAGKQA